MKSLGTDSVGSRDAAVVAEPGELVVDGARDLLQAGHEILHLVGQGTDAVLQPSQCIANCSTDTVEIEGITAVELEQGDDLVLTKQRLLLALLGPKLDRPVVLSDELAGNVHHLGIWLCADERIRVIELRRGLFSVGGLAESEANLCTADCGET